MQPEDSAWQELEEIFQHAITLDEMLHKSRAIYSFEDKYYRFNYAEEVLLFDIRGMQTMDGQPEGESGMPVDLVVAPGLIKLGNADGEGFETTTRLIKSWVVCAPVNEKKKKRSSRVG